MEKMNGTNASNGIRRNGTVANGMKKAEMPATGEEEQNLRDIIANGLRERVQKMGKDVLDRVDDRIDDMVSEIMEKMETAKPGDKAELVNYDKYRDKVKTSSEELLPSKQFQERNSMLTDLYEIPHIRTIYNIFLVILILLLIHTAVDDILSNGVPTIGINIIIRAFGKLPVVLHAWLWMKASVLGVYVAYCVWGYQRHKFGPNSALRKVWDYGWLLAFMSYPVIFCVLSTSEVVNNNLPIASSLIILMEQLRMLMKVHAFVRGCAPRFLSYKPHSDMPVPKAPSFSHFLYFMFAPTLVYRDSYPRTRRIRWRRVFYYFGEVLMTIFFSAFVFERFVIPAYRSYGIADHDRRSLVLNVFAGMMTGILFFLCGFYCLLHAWMNAFAELLRFADRLFYKDWWTSTSFNRYYRTWNVVVHDWLHTYIYKDMYEILTPRNKFVATSVVFVVSAVCHEYILAFAFGFFYPVLLFFFLGIGFALQVLGRQTGNMFVWLSLIVGNGCIMSFYAMEYYARINCPASINGFPDLVLPRSWFCPVNADR